jgi:hypothetical protein
MIFFVVIRRGLDTGGPGHVPNGLFQFLARPEDRYTVGSNRYLLPGPRVPGPGPALAASDLESAEAPQFNNRILYQRFFYFVNKQINNRLNIFPAYFGFFYQRVDNNRFGILSNRHHVPPCRMRSPGIVSKGAAVRITGRPQSLGGFY